MYEGDKRGLATCFAQPDPSYGDFTQLVQYEGWASDHVPGYLAYFTGSSASGQPPRPPQCSPEYPKMVAAAWTRSAIEWLKKNWQAFYNGPNAPGDWDAFLASLAVNGEAITGEERLKWQHFIVGVQPSDLYILSQKDKIGLRLGQAESGAKYLFLCGDWTDTDINAGCVEAATQSGMLASNVISTHPYVRRVGF